MTTPAPRVAAYLRVSSREQVEGYSLAAQERAVTDFCAQKGWSPPALYVEPGRSARAENTAHRPAFRAMLEATERGEHDVVLVHKLDRFARNQMVTLRELARLEHAGATFASIAEQMDFTTPIGRVMLALLAAFAQYYSDNLATEVRKGLGEIVAQGGHIGGPPFGATRDARHRLVVDPARAPLLAEVLALVAERGASEAAADLNRRGVPSPRGGVWWDSTVSKLVRRGAWLLDQEEPWPTLWGAARTRPRRPPVSGGHQRHMLTGLLRCACGGSLIYAGGRGTGAARRPGLQCRAKPCAARPTGGGCPLRRRLAAHYEALVSAWVAALPDLRGVPALATTDVAAARAAIARRRRLLGLAVADETLTEADYRARLDALDAEAAALPLATTQQPHLARRVWQIRLLWDGMTATERNDALRELVACVVVRGATIAVEPVPLLARLLPLAA